MVLRVNDVSYKKGAFKRNFKKAELGNTYDVYLHRKKDVGDSQRQNCTKQFGWNREYLQLTFLIFFRLRGIHVMPLLFIPILSAPAMQRGFRIDKLVHPFNAPAAL